MSHELKNITMLNNATYFRVTDNGQREVLCDVFDKDKQETLRVFITANLLFELGLLVLVPKCDEAKHYKRISWSEKASTFLRRKYDEYFPNLGPGKKFLRKKDIWTQISFDLRNELNMVASWKQVHNRYKSSLRNRKKSDRSVHGNSIKTEPIESEISLNENHLEKEIIEDSSPIMQPPEPIESEISLNENHLEKEIIEDSCLIMQPENINELYFINNDLDTGTQHFDSDFESNIMNTLLGIKTSEEEDNERRHEEQIELIESIILGLSSSVDKP